MKRSCQGRAVRGQEGRQPVINLESISISRASGGDPGHMQATANLPAAGAQFADHPCDFARASNTCVRRSRLGHGCACGRMNCGQPPHQSDYPLAGDYPQLRGLVPPASTANPLVTTHAEVDAWMVAQSSLSNMLEGGAPQACGNPYMSSSPWSGQSGPAPSGVAQSAGQHAGGSCTVSSW